MKPIDYISLYLLVTFYAQQVLIFYIEFIFNLLKSRFYPLNTFKKIKKEIMASHI